MDVMEEEEEETLEMEETLEGGPCWRSSPLSPAPSPCGKVKVKVKVKV